MGIERMGLEGAPEINRIQNKIQNQNEKRNVAAATAAERYSPCTPSSGGEGGSANMNMNMGMAAAMDGVPATFPAGLRVLVVDDDPICLKILDKMLRTCSYEVTTCSQATLALSLLRERKGGFDLVISDVYMPDMDGFKLLELIGLEMDLPVIMMSADGETSLVMKGIRHGACDYLLKPVRIEALKTIWQHVIRKRQNELKEVEHSESMEDGDRHRKVSDELEYASSMNEGNSSGLWKNNTKKRKDSKEDDDEGEQENDDSSTLKKPRVVWSVELHQEFVRAVNHLGIDKAVPKRILELMNVQGLTRENVASHLQKYRLYLKKLTGAGPQQSGFNSSFGGSTDINFGSIPSFDRHDLAAALPSPAGQMQRPQSLGGPFQGAHMNGNDATAGFDMPFLLQPPDLQNLNNNLQDRLRFGKQSLSNSEKNYLPGFPDLKHLQSSYQQHLSPYGSAAAQQQHQHHHLGSPASAANGARVFNQFNLLSVQMIHPQQQQQNHHSLLQRHLGQHQQQSVARDQSEAGTNGLQILNIPPISMLNPPPPPPPPHMIQTDAMGSIPNPCSLPNTNGFVASAGHLHHLPTSMAQSNEAAVTAAVSSEIQNHHNGYSHSRPPPLMGLSNCRDLNLPTGRTVSSSAGGGGMPEIEDSQSLENPGAVYNATAAANGYEHTERRWHLPSNVPNSAAAATDLQHAEASNNAGMIIEAQARDPKPKLQDEQLVDNHLADEAASSLMGNSDLDSRFPEPQFDDIISVLKQHQEDEAFSEGKFANGMYQLDASRMK